MLDQQRRNDVRLALEAWGQVIRRYRQWKGLSRRELALRAGLSPVFLGEIERGDKDPSSQSLCLIADALEVPITELYLRVAVQLEAAQSDRSSPDQISVPLGMREQQTEYLDAVPTARDETAFDLYKIVRLLPADQQISLLVLTKSLLAARTTSASKKEPSEAAN